MDNIGANWELPLRIPIVSDEHAATAKYTPDQAAAHDPGVDEPEICSSVDIAVSVSDANARGELRHYGSSRHWPRHEVGPDPGGVPLAQV